MIVRNESRVHRAFENAAGFPVPSVAQISKSKATSLKKFSLPFVFKITFFADFSFISTSFRRGYLFSFLQNLIKAVFKKQLRNHNSFWFLGHNSQWKHDNG